MNIEDFAVKVLGIDCYRATGEAIKDLVVCMLVIAALLDILPAALKEHSLQFLFYIGVMLVPIYYVAKWFEIIFGDKEVRKIKRRGTKK